MVKKLKRSAEDNEAATPFSGTVQDSAQQIWLAGLGAFAKAQAEGGKMFETLVNEGLGLQRKTQTLAEEKISETTTRLADIASGLTSGMVSKATGAIATGSWDKLENIFEDRVAKALNKLGVPSSKDVATLVARIDELTQTVQKLSPKVVLPVPKAPAATKSVASKGEPAVPAKEAQTVKIVAEPVTKPAAKRATNRKSAPVAPATKGTPSL